MKKLILISFNVTTALCVLNWILAFVFDSCIGIIMRGGEYFATYGFGILFEEFYPLTTEDDPVKYYNKISFEPVTFILTLFIILGISILIQKTHSKKNLN